jgi:hypothetical protein
MADLQTLPGPMSAEMSQLALLEAEAVHIFREVAGCA